MVNSYAIVENGVVVNVILWGGDNTTWQPPKGSTAIEITDITGPANIADTYDGSTFASKTS